jgi:FkbM family methyltransferase
MIRLAAKRILGMLLRRYRLPMKRGFIEIRDEIANKTLKLFWREDSFIETEFFRYGLYGSWERHSLRIWAHVARGAREILDIGANTGIYSLIARNNNATARIIAIEPIAINADILDANIGANRADVVVQRMAMSDREGEAQMFMLRDRLNYMTSVNDNRYALHPEIAGKSEVVATTVAVETYAALARRNALVGPDLIKVDVEGHEVSVLRSLLAHIRDQRPMILLEVIGDENATAINRMLNGLDYVYLAIDEKAQVAKFSPALWDNDHQNFLVCRRDQALHLQELGLAEGVALD